MSNKYYTVHVKTIVYDEKGNVVHNTTTGTSAQGDQQLERVISNVQAHVQAAIGMGR